MGNRQRVVHAKGATRPNHETVLGHGKKIGGHGPKFVRTPTQATGILVVRTDRLSERRFWKAPG